VDDRLAVDAGDQCFGGVVLEDRDVAQVHDLSAARAQRDAAQDIHAGLIGDRVEDLHVLRAVVGVELGGERPAERGPHRAGRRADVEVERTRAVTVELDVDLRRKLERGAVDVGRAGRLFEDGENLLRVGIGFAARRRDRQVDRLRVSAARSGRRDRDHPGVGHQLVSLRAEDARDVGGRSLAIVLEEHAQLTVRAEVDATAEAGLHGARR
jgi:hypothetical protein